MARSRGVYKRKANATGRNVGEQHMYLPYALVTSAAWRSLSGAAVKVFFELRTRYYGSNNGDLSLGLERGRKVLGIGKTTIDRAFHELAVKGFIKLHEEGDFRQRLARTWYSTDLSEGPGKIPTNDWKRWDGKYEPKPKRKALIGDDHARIWKAVP